LLLLEELISSLLLPEHLVLPLLLLLAVLLLAVLLLLALDAVRVKPAAELRRGGRCGEG